jgi:mono/diheme cytochrome c family protein
VGRESQKRAALLVTIGGLALLLVACGRASEADIFAAVGITPTATLSADQIAASTATASAQQTADAAAAGSPAAGSPAAEVAALGDVNRGRSTFGTWCQNCHTPGGGGQAPDILAPAGPGADLALDTFTVFIREGETHPPGPYRTSDFSDRQLGDLLAYILAESSS